jgi:MFS family permease
MIVFAKVLKLREPDPFVMGWRHSSPIMPWTALKNRTFRKLWLATVISGTCVAAHECAATWSMNLLAASPLLISLMSTVASLPFFLFTLPAGALADRIDRRKFVCAINLWLAATAIGLAVLGWLHLLNPFLILVCVFLIGVGFAFNAPAWTSIVPQVVSDAELPSAVILSGLQLNVSGIIGPALAALLVPLAGANFVFALNAACFLLVVLATWQWKQPTMLAKGPPERFFESFQTLARYVRRAPGLQVVLARNFLFALFISAIPALIPVVGLKVLQLSSSNFGLLFTSMGAGSVLGAVFIFPWLRARFSPDSLTVLANLLIVIAYVLMALVRRTEVFFIVAALAGVGWTLSASELWVAAQRAMPSWGRGRMNAAVMMISQGAMVLGGTIWGSAAAIAGATCALFGAAVLFLVSLLLAGRLSINFTRNLPGGLAYCDRTTVGVPVTPSGGLPRFLIKWVEEIGKRRRRSSITARPGEHGKSSSHSSSSSEEFGKDQLAIDDCPSINQPIDKAGLFLD